MRQSENAQAGSVRHYPDNGFRFNIQKTFTGRTEWVLSVTHMETPNESGARFLHHRQEGNTMSDNVNHVMNGLRRLNSKFDETGEQMTDFLKRQAAGEKPDPDEFAKLLEKRAVTHDVMAAQFKLYEKPLKTVLQETR
jgi:hypothetical protein